MSEFAVRRPVSILMLCIGLIVLGLIAATRIPMQLMPNIFTPEFEIVTQFRGATPEEVENLLTAPIERTISTVSGLLRTESTSERERSSVKLKFSSSINLIETISALRDKLDMLSLPDGVSKPKILRFQANAEPVIRVALIKNDTSLSTLELSRYLQDILVRKLESLDGVAMATLLGAPTKQIEVEVDPVAIQAYGINISSLPELIQAKNKTYPAGEIKFEGHRVGVKLGQSLASIAELRELIIKKDDEKFLRLGDISKIREVIAEPLIKTHLQAVDSLVIEVRKEAEGNAVVVANKAKAVIAEFLEENQNKVKGLVLYDQGKEIETAIDGVKDAVRDGGILAALIIFILLQAGWATFVISLSIPLSIMLALVLMYFTGITFNLMSLAGLALGVGMLVDNSTVVLQSINNELLVLDDPKEAALWGTRKVAGAITGSTLTSIAVFAPLAFVDGVIGQMFRDVAATVSYSMLASLFIALLVVPMLSAIRIKPKFTVDGLRFNLVEAMKAIGGQKLYQGPTTLYFVDFIRKCTLCLSLVGKTLVSTITLRSSVLIGDAIKPVLVAKERWLDPSLGKITGYITNLEDFVARVVPAVIVDSKITIRVAVVSTIVGLVILGSKGAELFPDEGVDRVVFNVEYAAGQVIELTETNIEALEVKILELPDVQTVSSIIGGSGSHSARLIINAAPSRGASVFRKVNAVLSHVPGMRFDRVKETTVGQGKPVQVEIYNDNLEKLKELSKRAASAIRKLHGLADVEGDIKSDISEVNISFLKNKLGWYGVDSQTFVSPLRAMIMGQNAGILRENGEDVPVRITVPASQFNSVDKLRSFGTEHENRRVYLSQISDLVEGKVTGTIQRLNRKRVALITANLNATDLETAARAIKGTLDSEFKSEAVQWRIGGEDEERKRSERSLIFAIILSIFLIYLMLAAQFESLVQPIVILSAVPLCLSGVAISLLIFGMNMSAMVFVGLILLVGVSINTSIVMVDFANQLVAEGKTIHDAITEATVRRLKPIIVTLASNVLGLVPMVLSLEQGSAMQRPLAVTLIGGHLSSTILTIFAVPIIYARLTRGPRVGEIQNV